MKALLKSQRGISQILVLLLLLGGIGLGTYLVQQRTNLLPKAQESSTYCDTNINVVRFSANTGIKENCNLSGKTCVETAEGAQCAEVSQEESATYCDTNINAVRFKSTTAVKESCGNNQVCLQQDSNNAVCTSVNQEVSGCTLQGIKNPDTGVANSILPRGGEYEGCDSQGNYVRYICKGNNELEVPFFEANAPRCDTQAVSDKNCVINITRDGKHAEEGFQIKNMDTGELLPPYNQFYKNCTFKIVEPSNLCNYSKTCSYAQDNNGDGKTDACYKGVCKNADCSNCGYDAACANKFGLGQSVACTGSETAPKNATQVTKQQGETQQTAAGSFSETQSSEGIKLPTPFGFISLGTSDRLDNLKSQSQTAFQNYQIYQKILQGLKEKGIDVTRAQSLIDQGTSQTNACINKP